MATRSRAFATSMCLLAVLGAATASALPRYSARYGQRCALCHFEPTGGGLRTQYASMALIPEELSFNRMDPEELATIRPDLSPAVTVGLDLRSLYYGAEGGQSGQIDMQGDLYLGVQASRQMAAYVAVGKRGNHEYAGLAYVLPLGGYVKAGRFRPDYGWRWVDHKMAGVAYLLDENGTESAVSLTEPGFEVGMHEQWWEATASLLQGGGRNGESYAARLALRKSVGTANLALGSSILRRERPDGHLRAWGGFGYVAAGPVNWVFQVDETGNPLRRGILVSQELSYRLVRGIHARGTYSFQDPDHSQRNGTRNRWGIGVDSLINPFFGALVMANYHHFRRGELVTEDDYWQGELVLHFLY